MFFLCSNVVLTNFFIFFFHSVDNWEDNWVYSKAEGKEFGKFELTAGKFYNDAENDKGKFNIKLYLQKERGVFKFWPMFFQVHWTYVECCKLPTLHCH